MFPVNTCHQETGVMIKPEHARQRSFDGNISLQTRGFLDSPPTGFSVDGGVHRASFGGVQRDTALRAFDEGDWPRFAPAVREKVQPAC